MRAEVEPDFTPFLSIPLENRTISLNHNLSLLEQRAIVCQSSGSPLAIAAVAHVHHERVTGCVYAQ
jgi:hypothetical protein